DVVGGRQELVLADLDRLPRLEVDGDDLARPVAGEGDLALAGRLGQEDRHPGDEALEGALHRLELDVDVRLLPEQDLTPAVGRDGAAELEAEDRDELALDVVEEVRALPV